MKNKLTAKQEKFCLAIADGKTQMDAFKFAYGAKNYKDNAIYVQASRILDNPKIVLRIDELKKAVEKKYLWTKEMSIRALMQAYREGAPSVKVSAVKELNAMHGFNAPSKLDVTTEIKPMVVVLESE